MVSVDHKQNNQELGWQNHTMVHTRTEVFESMAPFGDFHSDSRYPALWNAEGPKVANIYLKLFLAQAMK